MFNIKIFPDGQEPFTITAKSRDVAFWERVVKNASLTRISENPKMSELEEFAYVVARKQGKFIGELDDFRQTCDFEMVEAEDSEQNPTQSAP